MNKLSQISCIRLLNLEHFVLLIIEFIFLRNLSASGIQLTVLDTDALLLIT